MKLRTRIAHEVIFWLTMAATFVVVYWLGSLLFSWLFGSTVTLNME